MSDSELLRELDGVRDKSPVIQELCIRLEENLTETEITLSTSEDTKHSVKCPICQAMLFVDYDINDDEFSTTVIGS